MRDLLKSAGFADITITKKENAADIIKDWMPGSGAEKYVTSVYVAATKPIGGVSVKDDPRSAKVISEPVFVASQTNAAAGAGV